MLGYSEDVDGLLLYVQTADGFVDELVSVLVEALGRKDFANYGIGIALYHQRSEHGLFEFGGLRLQTTVFVGDWGLRLTRFLSVCSLFLFGHKLGGIVCLLNVYSSGCTTV